MDNHFEMGLEALRQKLLLMASHAEAAVNDSVRSLMQHNRDLALKVRVDDDIIER
jgi:phosphate uptake regulator